MAYSAAKIHAAIGSMPEAFIHERNRKKKSLLINVKEFAQKDGRSRFYAIVILYAIVTFNDNVIS